MNFFGKVKVETKALASIIDIGRYKDIYSVKTVQKDAIILTGNYPDRGKINHVLKIKFTDGKAYFEDIGGNLITHIKQGVEQTKVFEQLKEIYNII